MGARLLRALSVNKKPVDKSQFSAKKSTEFGESILTTNTHNLDIETDHRSSFVYSQAQKGSFLNICGNSEAGKSIDTE
jgi:hypothetical protein